MFFEDKLIAVCRKYDPVATISEEDHRKASRELLVIIREECKQMTGHSNERDVIQVVKRINRTIRETMIKLKEEDRALIYPHSLEFVIEDLSEPLYQLLKEKGVFQ